MGNVQLLKKYEVVVILDTKLTNEEKEAVIKEVTQIIGKTEVKILNSRVWLDKYKLTFPIKKCREGTYYLINFESDPSAVKNIESLLRLNERILRFIVTKTE